MTSKVLIDQAALAKQIREALVATAATFGQALDQAAADLPVQRSERLTKGGYEFSWTGTGDLSAVQLHEGAVLKNGDSLSERLLRRQKLRERQRIPAQPWTVMAQAEVNLVAEFRKNF